MLYTNKRIFYSMLRVQYNASPNPETRPPYLSLLATVSFVAPDFTLNDKSNNKKQQ